MILVVVDVFVDVVVAASCDASGSFEVLLLVSMLAKPEYGVNVKLAISVVVRNNRITKLLF
jgi:hypothetical protein